MTDVQEKNPTFIGEFVEDVLRECGLSSEIVSYVKIKEGLERRVVARLLLEVVALLTPAEANQMRKELDESSHDALEKLISQKPEASVQLASSLVRMRSELVQDLKALS